MVYGISYLLPWSWNFRCSVSSLTYYNLCFVTKLNVLPIESLPDWILQFNIAETRECQLFLSRWILRRCVEKQILFCIYKWVLRCLPNPGWSLLTIWAGEAWERGDLSGLGAPLGVCCKAGSGSWVHQKACRPRPVWRARPRESE